MAEVNMPGMNIPEHLPKNYTNNNMLSKAFSSLIGKTGKTGKTRYNNTRKSKKSEKQNTPTGKSPQKTNISPEAKRMMNLYNTVPKCVTSLKNKSNILEKLCKEHLILEEVPTELYDDLKDFQQFVKEFDVSTFQSYVLHHNLLNFEDINSVKEFDPINPESDYSMLLLRNNMKLGWFSLILYKPVEKLVGVN
jgi:hypothetical protein